MAHQLGSNGSHHSLSGSFKTLRKWYVMMDLQSLHAYLFYSIGRRYSTQAGEYHVNIVFVRGHFSPTWDHSSLPHLQSYHPVWSLWQVLFFLCSTQVHTLLRDLCVAYPDFDIYHDVELSYFLLDRQSKQCRYSRKSLRSLSQKILFGVIVFMFTLSTAYLAVSIADLIILIKTWYLLLSLAESDPTETRSPTETYLTLFNALAPINVGGRSYSHNGLTDCK